MAKRSILVSDLTGKVIEDNDGAQVTIKYADARKGVIVLDVLASEVETMAKKGTKRLRPGRRPATV